MADHVLIFGEPGAYRATLEKEFLYVAGASAAVTFVANDEAVLRWLASASFAAEDVLWVVSSQAVGIRPVPPTLLNQLLDNARNGLLCVDSEYDVYDRWPKILNVCEAAGLAVPQDWIPGQALPSPWFGICRGTFIHGLQEQDILNRLLSVQDVTHVLPAVAWLGLLGQLFGQYRIAVGSTLRPMPPLLCLPMRPGLLCLPPHLVSHMFSVYAPVSAAAGWDEAQTRAVIAVMRGERVNTALPQQSPTAYFPGGPIA